MRSRDAIWATSTTELLGYDSYATINESSLYFHKTVTCDLSSFFDIFEKKNNITFTNTVTFYIQSNCEGDKCGQIYVSTPEYAV